MPSPGKKLETLNENLLNKISINVSPNPFENNTNIVIEIQQDEILDLVVYDVMGKPMEKIIDHQFKPAGTYQFRIKGEKWQPGVYFILLRSNHKSISQKIILVK